MTPPPGTDATPAAAGVEFVERALRGIGCEYPSHVALLLERDTDLAPPRELTPAFYGCFDWHSAVHGHWCIVRGERLGLPAALSARARTALGRSFEHDRLAREAAYIGAPERAGFERPYGLAWLLQLATELREWGTPRAFGWHDALRPLETLALDRLLSWLPKLRWPIRTGEHSQTAFALGLALDHARARPDPAAAQQITTRAVEFYGGDRAAPIAYEPSGHDFLSPALGEADLMRRVLEPGAFSGWLGRFLPGLGDPASRTWLTPVAATDRSDGKLAHLDGLNLSRAWMLDGVAAALEPGDARRRFLLERARDHERVGVAAALDTRHYAGTHWLGSFAVYALTGRGLPGTRGWRAPEPSG